MKLNSVAILNYKNIAEARLVFSPKVNCLIGNNGMGKTNVLDAIYYLSFCKSNTGQLDASVINHDADYMLLQGNYTRRDAEEDISMGMKRGKRKVARRGGKEYQRLTQHIGLLPLVMVSPIDSDLIHGASDDRRRFIDMIISQGDSEYLNALVRYNRGIEQRNSMIKNEFRDALLYETVESQLCEAAAKIHLARQEWVEKFQPIFLNYYRAIAGENEPVSLGYRSHLNSGDLKQHFDATRQRDFLLGYTTRGVHRDDIEFLLGNFPMRRTGSQGQCKTYTMALRFAQFEFLKQHTGVTPILLLDDIFDRLDAERVERIIEVVSGTQFGQIFITDTNRTHLDEIIARQGGDRFAMFEVSHGKVSTSTALLS